MIDVTKHRLPERLFALSLALLVFGYGFAVGQYELFPFSVIQFGWSSLRQVFSERGTLLGTRPAEFLEPARYRGDGVTVLRSGEAVPGLTMLAGFFDGGNQIRMVRLDGSVVHKWPVAYFDEFSSTDHIQPADQAPKTNWNAAVHGSLALPDGSIVFNFTYKGTVKLDRCGKTQWTIARMTHHSVNRSADGTFWIPSSRYIASTTTFPNLRPPFVEDTILKVSERGEILTEISIEETLFKNNLQGMLLWKRGTGDITHVNDVEELTPELAPHFPMFAAGDLLVSMRMQHMIFVMDPKTLAVKWTQIGPWIGQHDPDFLDSGRILVFNNNDDGKGGSAYGGSNIMEVDPATHQVTYRYGTLPDQRMFTHERGKHQELSGGHILITEANPGRAFEVDAAGKTVWEFVNRYDDKDAALITEATRYPEDYFKVSDWGCR
jgi:hypothetical protein